MFSAIKYDYKEIILLQLHFCFVENDLTEQCGENSWEIFFYSTVTRPALFAICKRVTNNTSWRKVYIFNNGDTLGF